MKLNLIASSIVVLTGTLSKVDAKTKSTKSKSAKAKSSKSVVRPGESIQAALDSAGPGHTIFVEKGTYTEDPSNKYGLRIEHNDVRLIGEDGMVRLLANGNQKVGVYAAPPGCNYTDKSCPLPYLKNFIIEGFSVERFPWNGIQTRWVDGFHISHSKSIDNLWNGIYPTLSKNGVVESCYSIGALDAGLWVAGSYNVVVRDNVLTEAPTGLEITVSDNVHCINNKIYNNTVGVGLYHPNMAGNPPVGIMENWVVENNLIYDNNLINTAPPGSFQASLIPGIGVLVIGVSGNSIIKNEIRDNSVFAVAVLGYCSATSLTPLPDCDDPAGAPIANPSADNNTIAHNTFIHNAYGDSPFPPPFPGVVDIIYLNTPPGETGEGNCFKDNEDKDGLTSFPPPDQLPHGGCE